VASFVFFSRVIFILLLSWISIKVARKFRRDFACPCSLISLGIRPRGNIRQTNDRNRSMLLGLNFFSGSSLFLFYFEFYFYSESEKATSHVDLECATRYRKRLDKMGGNLRHNRCETTLKELNCSRFRFRRSRHFTETNVSIRARHLMKLISTLRNNDLLKDARMVKHECACGLCSGKRSYHMTYKKYEIT